MLGDNSQAFVMPVAQASVGRLLRRTSASAGKGRHLLTGGHDALPPAGLTGKLLCLHRDMGGGTRFPSHFSLWGVCV